MADAAAGLAHDINNLLQVVQAYTDFAKAGPLSLQQRDDLKFATDAARRGALLTKQMLDLCHQRGSTAIVCELNHAIGNLSELLRGTLKAGVRLEARPSPAPLFIRCAPDQIDRVVLNLVLNARDAMQEGGSIAIELGRAVVRSGEARTDALPPGDYATLTVADTGPGVPKELEKRIFETRLTTKPEGTSSGLGLAVVREAVLALGGSLRLESELGIGTKFIVYLPLASTESGRAKQGRVERAGMPSSLSEARRASKTCPHKVEVARRPVVLVVDDDLALRESLVRVLLEADLDALGVTGAEQALARLGAGGVDVVIANDVMTGMDGISFLTWAHERFPDVARILLTAPAAADVILAAIDRAHVEKVLLKNMHPVTIREEIAALALTVLDRKRR